MFIDYHRVFSFHQFGENATGTIAHFSAPLDCFVSSMKKPPPINMKLASSSCLAKDAEECTLEPAQLRILGLSLRNKKIMKRDNLYRSIIFILSLFCIQGVSAQTFVRSAGEGCVWKPYEFKQLGIRLNYKDCADPDSRFVLRQDGDWIMQHRPADNVIFGSDHFIQVFSKPEHQSIEAAIKEQIVANISISEWKQASRNLRDQKSARAVCRAVVMKTRRGLSADKIRLEIYPKNGAYYSRIKQDLKKFPRDFGCGEYGAGQGGRYFEYHPTKSKTRFIFVEFGWDDDALFDENSIEIFEPEK